MDYTKKIMLEYASVIFVVSFFFFFFLCYSCLEIFIFTSIFDKKFAFVSHILIYVFFSFFYIESIQFGKKNFESRGYYIEYYFISEKNYIKF